jgi:mRNA interferase HigB
VLCLTPMKVHGLRELDEFCKKHPIARSWVRGWIADASGANWTCSHDIRNRYVTASFLATNLVIFNVKGNEYRMVTQVAYKMGVVVVKWIGTHAAYSKINWDRATNETSGS